MTGVQTCALPIYGIVDLEGVDTVFGDLVIEDRVGMEEEVVGILDFLARGIRQPEGGLKPAGDGVGDGPNSCGSCAGMWSCANRSSNPYWPDSRTKNSPRLRTSSVPSTSTT